MNVMVSTPTEAEPFLKQSHKLLIGGEWVEAASGKSFDVVNPATGQVITKVAEGDVEDVNRAVAAARAAFEEGKWAGQKPVMRARVLFRAADLIEQNAEELAQLETLDNGKPLAQARADVAGSANNFRYYAGWIDKVTGSTVDMNMPGDYHAYTLKEPVGVAALITPWNFPIAMASWKLAPALAAGCACILKPAEETPLTALRLTELLVEAGVPEGVVNVVTGFGHTAGAALASHPQVDKVAFTGSTEVGKLIVQAAAGNLKKVSLELGGKAPN
ncbi:MAG: aldehyde dehydrogenase family protein, partial [Pseudomonadota bacterium]